MIGEDAESLLHAYDSVSGGRRSAWTFVGISILLAAAACGGLGRSAETNASPAWTGVAIVLFLIGCGSLVLGVRQFRMPVQFGLDGRSRNRRIEGAEIRWHPTFAGLADEVQCRFDCFASRGRKMLALAEHGAVSGRLLLDDVPLRTGSRVRMTCRISPNHGRLALDNALFRLRCVIESHRRPVQLSAAISRFAEVDPADVEADHDRTEFQLVFDLPADAPGADLLAVEPVVWELAVVLEEGTATYHGRFFLPVVAS